MKNNSKRKYGRGDDRKDGRLVMRMTNTEDQRLQDLTQYLGKSRSDVMRDALDMLYESEGGDEIRNKPPKEVDVHFTLSPNDLDRLTRLTQNNDVSASDVIKRALELYSVYKDGSRT